MELYVLDSLLRRTAVIDSFESLLWAERFNAVGDMTLNIHSTLANRNLLTRGALLAMNKSTRCMIIETVEDKTNNDGSKTMIVTGSSFEILMDDRPAWDTMNIGSTAEPNWTITGTPGDIARAVFKAIMIDGVLDPNDVLPFYAPGTLYLFPASYMPEPSTVITMNLDHGSVLDVLINLCQTYDLGFRISRNRDNSQLFFNVYAGSNRTTQQSVYPVVAFSPELDNLSNASYLTSQKQYKNIAYMWCPDGTRKVYDQGIDPTISGFDRHVLYINATDITYPDRTIGPAYVVTQPQIDTVKIARDAGLTTDAASDSLEKITSMKRLLPIDLTNISVAMANVFSFTGTQLASVNAAKTVTGVTNDQKNALTKIAAMTRLTDPDQSALNTMLANVTGLTTAEKTDIPAVLSLLDATVLPSEVTIINAAVATSVAYNPTEDAALQALLEAKGQQELQKYNNITAFDGEIPQYGEYRYDREYSLGDIVEVRGNDGVVSYVRVTEQIFSQDEGGEKSYPTLSSRLVVTPGVWASRNPNQDWADVPDTEHWADLS